MTKTIRLTMAQALTRYLTRQFTEIDGEKLPLFGGVWAIFGHGNVAAIGEALYQVRDELPTFRAHNEQAMAHAAIGFGKANFRRRMMVATTSIGPGALNMVTAAALAHVNRLPVLLLPGDVFANRIPDPVLQQVENFGDGTMSANDCFRPVSRYFDRITRPEQIVPALARAMQVLTDPAECGPVTLSLCQDVQAEAYDYPVSFFEERIWTQRRSRPDVQELNRAADVLRNAKKPVIIAGGGVLFSQASDALRAFVEATGIPVCETQGGKSSLPDAADLNMGAVGVTGTSAANRLAEDADVILAVGTRLQDFTTGSWALFKKDGKTVIGLNVQPFDAGKQAHREWLEWSTPTKNGAKLDLGMCISAMQAALPADAILCNGSGNFAMWWHRYWHFDHFPAQLTPACGAMGYGVPAAVAAAMRFPDRCVVALAGDGDFLMNGQELATAAQYGCDMLVIVVDNGGYGTIRMHQERSFPGRVSATELKSPDFAALARGFGAWATRVETTEDFAPALAEAQERKGLRLLHLVTEMEYISASGHTVSSLRAQGSG